jgi:hypothetical protein
MMSELQAILARQHSASSEAETARKELKELQEQVISGAKSIGSPYDNFALVHFGLDEKLKEEYKFLNDMKKGDEIVVVNNNSWTTGKGGCFSSPFQHEKSFVRFGILQESPILDLTSGVQFPMERYAWFETPEIRMSGIYRQEWKPQNSPILLNGYELSSKVLDHYGVGFSQELKFKKRDDLPEHLRHDWSHHHGDNKRENVKIFTGKGINEFFRIPHTLQKESKQHLALDQARSMVKYGLSIEGHKKKLEEDHKNLQYSTLETLDEVLAKKGNVREALEKVVKIGAHKVFDTYQSKQESTTWSLPNRVQELCIQYGVKYG